MKVLILAPGSRGDLAPVARIGAGLVADGHWVTVVAHSDYAASIAQADCQHASFDLPLHPPAGETGVRAYLDHLRSYMRAAAETSFDAAHSGAAPGAILTNPIAPYGHDVAEALGVPSAEALLQPSMPSRDYPPMTFSQLNLGRAGNRGLGQLAQRVPTPVDPATKWVRHNLGLAPESPHVARKRRMRAGVPIHHGIDAAVLPRPADWPAHLSLDGFWWPLEPPDWQPPSELVDFLDAGPAPVLVSMGSIDASRASVTAIEDFVKSSKDRVLVQGAGWEKTFQAHSNRVLVIGDVPHSWLLPRMKVVIHQAGAGVSAACLRAEVPSVPLPQHTDQFFWARTAVRLGAGVSAGATRSVTDHSLSRAVDIAVETTEPRRSAQRVGQALTSADSTKPIRTWVAHAAG